MAYQRLFALTLASAVVLAGCGGGGSGDFLPPARGDLLRAPQMVATLTKAQIDQAAQAAGLAQLAGAAQCDVGIYALDYATIGAHGESGTNASGALLVPQGPAGSACNQPASLVAYARGTELTRGRTMANPNDPETALLTAFYAAQGYAVAATDYLGYAQSDYSYHPYLHADSEASAVIDSVRAVRNSTKVTGANLSGKVVLMGYSQGGHASMAAQRNAERDDGGEIDVVAGAHLAGPYNLAGQARSAGAIAGYQFFVPFMITAWQKVYGDIYQEPEDVFREPYADGIDDLLPSATLNSVTLVTSGKLPGGTPEGAKEALMQPAFLERTMTDDASPFNVAARANTLFDWKPKAPALLCGGAGDPTVPPAMHQDRMMANFTANGVTNVTSVDVDGAIQQAFGPGGHAPTDPASPAFANYYAQYHGTFEPPFCFAAARRWLGEVLR